MGDFRRASRFRCQSSWPTCSATITSNKSSNRGRTAWQAERQPPRKQSATLRGSWHSRRSRRKAGARDGRIRVPSVIITNKMIMVVIEEAAKTFKVPVSAIYESNIHNLLKNRQLVVSN
jgi:hypothetical protein